MQMVGSLLYAPPKQLPQDLQGYMDSCQQGVLYVSMGTLGMMTDPELQSLAGGLARLPQCVLWKLGADDLPGTVVAASLQSADCDASLQHCAEWAFAPSMTKYLIDSVSQRQEPHGQVGLSGGSWW